MSMTREESLAWAKLLQAQGEGKQLQKRCKSDTYWKNDTLDAVEMNISPVQWWRIAPDLPPKPSQEWLDQHGLEIVAGPMSSKTARGNYSMSRVVWMRENDRWVVTNLPAIHCFNAGDVDNVYVVRFLVPQYRPIPLSPVYLGRVVRSIGGHMYGILSGISPGGVYTIPGHGNYSPESLLGGWVWEDSGLPCGEEIK